MKKPADRHYLVGKGRPPVVTRWKPGQSGNPKGRPRGVTNGNAILNDMLNTKVRIKEDGIVRHMTRFEISLLQLVRNAMKGDIKAIMLLLSLQQEASPVESEEMPDTKNMTVQELQDLYVRTIKKPY